eukprot:CAMPEP_0196575306 /NCGR_PEP_ID=MMETSP1081-20130531/4814_1 /TAXON_ID=36882 /ORGANISM="Pyramimonas amylifera, Strain CCMP720" /LENGTH=123 /DNA_ID=CAMNT_0041893565 /DNA_START=220 /DNA_END=587 /DNA_ORIENTATION=+
MRNAYQSNRYQETNQMWRARTLESGIQEKQESREHSRRRKKRKKDKLKESEERNKLDTNCEEEEGEEDFVAVAEEKEGEEYDLATFLQTKSKRGRGEVGSCMERGREDVTSDLSSSEDDSESL